MALHSNATFSPGVTSLKRACVMLKLAIASGVQFIGKSGNSAAARKIPSDDKAAPAKQRRALEVVAEHRRAGTGVVSLQVLQEYFVTVTQKLGVDARIARRKIELLAEFDVAAPDVADILAAIDLHRLHGFSFWDALVLRAAKQAGCSVLLSEDFQESREIDGVRVVNPFLRM